MHCFKPLQKTDSANNTLSEGQTKLGYKEHYFIRGNDSQVYNELHSVLLEDSL